MRCVSRPHYGDSLKAHSSAVVFSRPQMVLLERQSVESSLHERNSATIDSWDNQA
jgi:hypothetical protein